MEFEKDWPTQLEKIKARMRSVGLPFCDPAGRSILPTEPPKPMVVEVAAAPTILDEHTMNGSGGEKTALGVKIRVWHRDPSGERSSLLGMVHLTEEVCGMYMKNMRLTRVQTCWLNFLHCTPTVVSLKHFPISPRSF